MTTKTFPTTRRAPWARQLLACSGLALALAAGCSEPPPPSGQDMTGMADMGGGQMETKPVVVPVSADGHDRFFGVAYGAGGEFFAAGAVADGTATTADFKMVVAKFSAAGALDKSFGKDGFAIRNVAVGAGGELGRGIVVQSTGKIVVAGTIEHAGGDPRDRDVALIRFNADGSEDMNFGQGGVALLDLSAGEVVGENYVADTMWGLAAYPDDRLVVHAAQKRTGATDTDFAVVRLTADGMRDGTFGMQGVMTLDINNRSASPRHVILLPAGNIIASGYYTDGTGGPVKPVLYKVNSMGQLDQTFGMNGVFSQSVLMAVTEVYAVALQGTSLVTTGYGRNEATETLDWLSLRITAGGMLDTTYGTNGYTRVDVGGFNDNSRHLVILPDNRPMLIGGGRPTENNVDGVVAVLTTNGQKDTTFSQSGFKTYDLGGTADMLWGSAVSPDKSRVALVGVKSSGMTGNDDGAILLLSVPR
jgi:uncharacterized delta-60 repeat protein